MEKELDLLWHDIFYLFDCVEKAGCTPWMWSTMYWDEKMRKPFLEKMPRSVLQSSGWYNRIKKMPDGRYNHAAINTYLDLDEAGFTQVPTMSFFEGYCLNAEQTFTLVREELHDDQVRGIMTAPWRNTRTENKYSLLDDAYRFGLAKKKIYPNE